jgi:hypothetical protein
MKLKSIAAAIFAVGAGLAQAEPPALLEMSPLYKEVLESNEGIELVHPYAKWNDTNADGYAETVFVRFDVYDAAGTVKLLSTPGKLYTLPASPCVSPIWRDGPYLDGFKFLGGNVLRSHVAMNIRVECEDMDGGGVFKEAFKTLIYSADPSNAASGAWAKGFNLQLVSFDGIDVDQNDGGANELVLTMAVPLALVDSIEAANTRTIAMEGVDGTIVFDKQRAIFR